MAIVHDTYACFYHGKLSFPFSFSRMTTRSGSERDNPLKRAAQDADEQPSPKKHKNKTSDGPFRHEQSSPKKPKNKPSDGPSRRPQASTVL